MTRQDGTLYTVVYDGHCGVCTRLAAKLARLDRRGLLEIIPSQQPGIEARFPWITARDYAESLQLIRKSDGRTWRAAAAVEEIIKTLRGGWLLSWLFAIPFARPIAERMYRWIADHRGDLGCGEHCSVHEMPPDAVTKNS